MEFLKEMEEVKNFMNLRPIMTMLGDDQCKLSSMVALSKESAISIHRWLMAEKTA